MTEDQQQQVDETNSNNSNSKRKDKSDDLLNLNPTTTDSTQTTTLEQQQQTDLEPEINLQDKPFNINDFQGFPMEQWVKYQGSINDARQRRRVAISNLEKYKCRYNKSDDNDLPEWDVLELQYHPITVQAWQKRQSDTAEIEDRQREIGAIDLQLAEIQNSIRIRTLESGRSELKSNTTQTLEELQKTVVYIQNLEKNMKKNFQAKKIESDRYAFKIYFHADRTTYDKIRADDLEDIIGACDWKQSQGPANLLHSKNSPTQAQPGVR